MAEKCLFRNTLDQMFLGVMGGMRRLFLVSDFFLAPNCLASPEMEMAHPRYFPFQVVCFQILCSDCCTPRLQISVSHKLPLVLNGAAQVKLINYVAVSPSAHFTIPAASPFQRQLFVVMCRTSIRICSFLPHLQQKALKEKFSDFICSLILYFQDKNCFFSETQFSNVAVKPFCLRFFPGGLLALL